MDIRETRAVEKTELAGMTLKEAADWMQEQGFPAFRGKQVFEWVHRGADFDGMTNLPKEMRLQLKEKAIAQSAEILLQRKSALDGTVKLLFGLKDGNCIEGVLMRYKYGISLCISNKNLYSRYSATRFVYGTYPCTNFINAIFSRCVCTCYGRIIQFATTCYPKFMERHLES